MSGSGVTMVGSANMDLVFAVERIPRPGETLLATGADRYPGGKGLNQAVASARAGAVVRFVGAVGRDDYGRELEAVMTGAGIDTGLLRRVDAPSGQAFIAVDPGAENTIIVASGANGTVTELTAGERAAIAGSSVVLAQLELPVEAVLQAAEAAREGGASVVLNAAPARAVPPELLERVDCLIVNEHEALIVGEANGDGPADLASASERLAARVRRLVVTLGAEGSVLYEDGAVLARVPAPRVEAVDTTGAGDTFCGAFCAAIAEGQGFAAAARFAAAAAALSVQTRGAVPSVPTRVAIDAWMEGPTA